MKLSTVNVIVQDCQSVITKLFAFGDSPEGNTQAEDIFAKYARKLGCTKEDIDSYTADGMYTDGVGNKVILCHSTN